MPSQITIPGLSAAGSLSGTDLVIVEQGVGTRKGLLSAVKTFVSADSQPLDATLTSIAGVSTAANKGLYFTGVDTAALFDITAFALTLLNDADAATARTTLELGNVNNTSDENKPVSIAGQAALDDKQSLDEKDEPSGYAGLDVNGLLDVDQIPDIPLDKLIGYSEQEFIAGDGITIDEDSLTVTISANASWTTVSTTDDIVIGRKYLANTNGAAFTLTLPATPAAGDTVTLADARRTWDTNNLTVARNGSLVEGAASDLVCDVEGAMITLIYQGADNGWLVQ